MKATRQLRLIYLSALVLLMLCPVCSFAQPSASATDARVLNDGPTYLLAWNIASTPNGYLIILKEGSPETNLPTDGTTYSAGQSFGGGTVFAIRSGGPTQYSFAKGALPTAGQDYYLTIYPYSTSGGIKYRTTDPGIAIFVKPGVVNSEPNQATNLVLSEGTILTTTQQINYTFDLSSNEVEVPFQTKYLIVGKFGSTPGFTPSDGVSVTTSTITKADVGNDEFALLASGSSFRITVDQSTEDRTLFVRIFAFNRISSSTYTENFGAVTASSNYNTVSPTASSLVVKGIGPNEPPSISDATFQIDEEPGDDFFVGEITVTDDNTAEPTLEIISGNSTVIFGESYVPFKLDGKSILVNVSRPALDYELASGPYSLTVRATDEDGATAEGTIAIELINLNDNSPRFNGGSAFAANITENPADDQEVFLFGNRVTDLDELPLSYTIDAGNEAGGFKIDETTGRLSVADPLVVDYETTTQFNLTVSVDDGNASATATLEINVQDVFDDPAPRIFDQTFRITSDLFNDDIIGTVTATDAQGDPITFSIVSGNDDDFWELDESTGELKVLDVTNLDFTGATMYSLVISASDGTNSNEATVNIKGNAAPIFSLETTSFSYDENTFFNILIAVSDPEDDDLNLTIDSGNDEDLLGVYFSEEYDPETFEMTKVWYVWANGNTIDFETKESFEIILKARDSFDAETLSDPINITINNLNDNAPTLDNIDISIGEGRANGALVTTVEAEDLDGDELIYSIVSGNIDNAFNLSNSGDLTVGNSEALVFAINPTFSLTISVTDGEFTDEGTLTVNITEASAPEISDQTFNILSTIVTGDEVGTIIATDAQGDPITYTILSGNTEGAFLLNETTGILTVADRDVLDFSSPNAYTLSVSVSDGTDASDANVTIILNNSPIFDWATTTFDFDENEAWTLEVPVSDAESDEFTLVISGGDNDGLFEVIYTEESETFELAPLTPFDFEVDPSSFTLTIVATDAFENITTSEAITITINNLNDNAPEAEDQTININQNLPDGILVTTIVATDADGDETITYEIVSGNTSDAFGIDSGSREITVTNTDALVFDTNPVFNLEVSISDGEQSSIVFITINLNEQNVNTAPMIEDQTFTLAENSENGTSVGIIEALDLEGDALTFSIISGNTSNAFLLTSSSGEILVTNSEVLDFETTPTFEFLVSVSDGAFTETATVTIELIDEDETPVLGAQANKQLMIYPNPASEFFVLEYSDVIETIMIIDFSGKQIQEHKPNLNKTYPVNGLNPGIYYVEIGTENRLFTRKLIIK